MRLLSMSSAVSARVSETRRPEPYISRKIARYFRDSVCSEQVLDVTSAEDIGRRHRGRNSAQPLDDLGAVESRAIEKAQRGQGNVDAGRAGAA
jgi:hypothetical protein